MMGKIEKNLKGRKEKKKVDEKRSSVHGKNRDRGNNEENDEKEECWWRRDRMKDKLNVITECVEINVLCHLTH